MSIKLNRAEPAGHPFHCHNGWNRISNLRGVRVGPLVVWVVL